MKRMPAGVFKAKCLAVMDEIQTRKEPVIVTKRGKPIVKIVPLDGEIDSIFGFFKGKGKIKGDVVAPVLSLKEWGNLG